MCALLLALNLKRLHLKLNPVLSVLILCPCVQAQVRRRTVRWWSQAREEWNQTVIGRGKKPFVEEVLCHWARNFPQVHLKMLLP